MRPYEESREEGTLLNAPTKNRIRGRVAMRPYEESHEEEMTSEQID
jgi:hypothetical protein